MQPSTGESARLLAIRPETASLVLFVARRGAKTIATLRSNHYAPVRRQRRRTCRLNTRHASIPYGAAEAIRLLRDCCCSRVAADIYSCCRQPTGRQCTTYPRERSRQYLRQPYGEGSRSAATTLHRV